MAQRSDNMAGVTKFGEAMPEGCYQFRVSKVEDDGAGPVIIFAVCQTEPLVGKNVRERCDLSQRVALEKLKSFYEAVHYHPEGGNHDPEQIVGGEFFAVITHNVDGGNTYANIAPWSIRSLEEGPTHPLGPKE